jgi:hypothetical protein
MDAMSCEPCLKAGWKFVQENGFRPPPNLARVTALCTVDRGVLASLLAWPEFEKRWANGAHPHFPVIGLDHV